jgi:neutral trehalase
MAESLDSIIAHLEQQKAAIDKALSALHQVGGMESSSPATHKGKVNLRSIAQKKRWAAKRAAEEGRANRGLTAEGRKRLAENMKRRWAAKHAAAKKSARKKAS